MRNTAVLRNTLLYYNVCLRVCMLKWEPLNMCFNTIHVYNSLKTKICPHVFKQASALIQSAEHSIALCTISALHRKGTSECTWIVQNRHSDSPVFWPCAYNNHTDWN